MINQWIKAAYLLIRYKIRYSPFIERGCGTHTSYSHADTGTFQKEVIHVNPFSSDFWEIFLHELGHAVYRKNHIGDRSMRNLINNMVLYDFKYNDKVFSMVLEEEAFASKFAARVSRKLNIECSKTRLLQWFYTYTGGGYKYLSRFGEDRVEYTNHVEKLIRKIEKA